MRFYIKHNKKQKETDPLKTICNMNGTQNLMKAKKAKKFIKELQIINKHVKRYFVYNKN